MKLIELDKRRINNGRLIWLQLFLRLLQSNPPPILRVIYKVIYRILSELRCVEIPYQTQIGEGLYMGHAYCITINPHVIIGKNLCVHRGVLIGQENRGCRKGYPVIGNNVWIGINSCVVGKITIGDDVLIAPNTYVNCDVPSHSVVYGNPCVIKHRDNATENYVVNPV